MRIRLLLPYLNDVFEDLTGDLSIGTEVGLDQLDLKTQNITHYPLDIGNTRDLPNPVFTIAEDSSGALWIGTFEGLY